ncbi:glycosyltransferase [Clostridium perfringens]|uniref:glycosyltransferase n=1 Tax=Clostridium perfringens TaxID=1502 RepID=UPI001CCE5F8D|nr:glycosyltransferase [Clostridium perfringens]UBK75591.1 glycosyltransferase [Clostridium perfringens]
MKKNILFVMPDLRGGGAEKVLVNLVNNLNSNKYSITVATLFNEGENIKRLNSNIRHIYLFNKIFRGYSIIQKFFSPEFLYRRLTTENYDIVVAYLEGVVTRIVSGCNSKNTKKIAWVHTDPINSKNFNQPFRNLREIKKVYSTFNEIIGVSQVIAKNLNELLLLTDEVGVKYNVIESENIKRLSKEEVRDFIVDRDIVNYCAVGRLIEVKGFERLLKVHKKLINNGVKCKLNIIGEGNEYKNLMDYIQKNNLEDSVELLGYKSNPYKYMKQMDLFVCSSYREGFSTAVTEALILGVPVITTACSGMDELLYDGKYGIIVDNNEEDLYKGLLNLITNQKLLEKYKILSKERGKLFNIKSTIQDVEILFDKFNKRTI